jgi:hypothetical protein
MLGTTDLRYLNTTKDAESEEHCENNQKKEPKKPK